jgi:ribonuclease HI
MTVSEKSARNAANAWCDGAVEPRNPGGTGGWGFLIEPPEGGEPIVGYGTMMPYPELSNNVMEYCAVGLCIHHWNELNRTESLHIRTDSKLVVEQLNGNWQAKKGAYLPFYARLKVLLTEVPFSVTFEWIPREENTRADELSKKGLAELGITPKVYR